jgi:hypothetical protein
MDDMDPSLAAADLVRDGAQFAYLQALGDAIDNNGSAVHLAAHGARDAWNRWQAWNSDDAEAEVPDSPTLMDLPAWRHQREEHDSDFTGAGYLSVSTMIAIGYEFHFAKERSFIASTSSS